MCCKPIATSAICRFPCQVFWNSHYLKISVSSSHTLPLLPYTHTYSVIEPSVNVVHVILHACNSIVVKPSSCIHLDSFKTRLDWLTALTGRKLFQFQLKLLPWLWMNSDIYATSVPSQCKAKEFKISDFKYAYSTAFLFVHCEFQLILKIPRTAL